MTLVRMLERKDAFLNMLGILFVQVRPYLDDIQFCLNTRRLLRESRYAASQYTVLSCLGFKVSLKTRLSVTFLYMIGLLVWFVVSLTACSWHLIFVLMLGLLFFCHLNGFRKRLYHLNSSVLSLNLVLSLLVFLDALMTVSFHARRLQSDARVWSAGHLICWLCFQ